MDVLQKKVVCKYHYSKRPFDVILSVDGSPLEFTRCQNGVQESFVEHTFDVYDYQNVIESVLII